MAIPKPLESGVFVVKSDADRHSVEYYISSRLKNNHAVVNFQPRRGEFSATTWSIFSHDVANFQPRRGQFSAMMWRMYRKKMIEISMKN